MNYINDVGYEVPDNTIVVIPWPGFESASDQMLEPLKGNLKRDWFTPHFYYCLPLSIANQYGFVVKSLRNFTMIWDGSSKNPFDVTFNFDSKENPYKQEIKSGFGQGIVTIQLPFSLKTPPGINLMTIQPPNIFIPGCSAMSGVVETDQIRRDFTFNIKITDANREIHIKQGDVLAAFIPIPRYFIDNFKIKSVFDIFDKELYLNEIKEQQDLSKERITIDKDKPHESGRRYFNGIHTDGSKYQDHQKRIL